MTSTEISETASDLELVEASADVERGAEQFLSRVLTTGAPATDEAVAGLWPRLLELGWFDLVLPVEHDGLGLSPAVLGGIVRTAARHLLPGPVLEHVLVAPLLLAAAQEDESKALLRRAAAGTAFLAFADADPSGAGRRLPTRIDGSVTGELSLVPYGGRADVLAVVVADGDEERLVLIDRHGAGVRVEDRSPLTPTHEVSDVVLREAPCHELPDSAALLLMLRGWLRILNAAWLAGIAEKALELTAGYVTERQQFGRPVGSFQSVQHTVADMAADVDTMLNLLSSTLSEAAERDGAPDELATLALMAHSARTSLDVCEAALQMHGGIGFTAEYPLHHYYKSAIALRNRHGDPEELLGEIGRRALL